MHNCFCGYGQVRKEILGPIDGEAHRELNIFNGSRVTKQGQRWGREERSVDPWRILGSLLFFYSLLANLIKRMGGLRTHKDANYPQKKLTLDFASSLTFLHLSIGMCQITRVAFYMFPRL